MFDNLGPIGAVNAVRRFLMDHKSGYADVREKLITASEEVSAVPTLTVAAELLTAGLVEDKFSATVRPAALQLLGDVTTVSAAFYYAGKADRWNELAAWAASELNNGSFPEPTVDPAYTTVAPTGMEMIMVQGATPA